MANLDLARYDGHTPGPWKLWGTANIYPDDDDTNATRHIAEVSPSLRDEDNAIADGEHRANGRLLRDAPLLLAEVMRLRAANERLRDCLAVLRLTAREYLAVSVPECAETGADLPRETWTPGFRAKFEALEQLAKEE